MGSWIPGTSALLPKRVAVPYSRLLALRRVFGTLIHYIHPGEPNQNADIERLTRRCLNEVLDLYVFNDIEEVRGEHIGGWLHITNNRLRICWTTDARPVLAKAGGKRCFRMVNQIEKLTP